MLLTATERILLQQLLIPTEGDIFFLRGVRKLREDVSFSEEEFAEFKISSAANIIRLDDTGRKKQIETGPRALEYIAACLKRASDAGKLNEGLLSVWDQIVGEE